MPTSLLTAQALRLLCVFGEEARQTAQAKRLLAGGKFALIVLGGAHDLSDNLGRLPGGKAEYIRVATKGWQERWLPGR